MAFPVVSAEVRDQQTTDATTFTISLPATVNSGELLVAVVGVDQNPAITWPSGWLTFGIGAANGAIVRAEARYKIADGTEGGTTIDVTFDSAQMAEAIVYRITSWHGTTAPEGATATGTSTTPDSPNLDPTGWATEDTLWLAGWVNDNGNRTFSGTYPTSYTSGSFQRTADAFGVGLGESQRDNAVSAEDPGTASALSTSDEWVAWTIAVRPAAAGGSPQTVAVTGLGTSQAFGSPTPVAGNVNVAITGLASSQAFGSVTAVPGTVTVPITGLGSSQAFGTPTPAAGPATVAILGLDSSQQFGSITPEGGEEPDATFNPAVHGGRHR